MYPNSAVDREFALTAARALAEQRGTDRCREIFSVLLRNKQLSHTVHHLNALLNNKELLPTPCAAWLSNAWLRS